MSNKLFEPGTLYDNAESFFNLNGDSSMKLSPQAAKEVCKEATKRGYFIGIIEGGYWRNPGFQPDMSTRWESIKYHNEHTNHEENNELAIANINEDIDSGHTAFLITLMK